MPSNLAGSICIGQYNACLLRIVRLNSTCTPLAGGTDRVVTTALVNMTATPDIEEATLFEPKNGCGDICWTAETCDKIKRWNLSGEFCYTDFEMMELLFGGSLVLGAAAGPYAGRVIGYAAPSTSNACNNGVGIEVFSQTSGAGVGACSTAATPFPGYIGHIFPRVKFTLGERTFENDVARVQFTGIATANPNYTNPWTDYPGAGAFPGTSGYVQVGYAALPTGARCGYV